MAPKSTPFPLTEQMLAQLAAMEASDLSAARRIRPELYQRHVVEQIAEAVRHAVRVDLHRAFRLAEAAVTIAAELGDPVSTGWAFRAKANALWFKNDLRSAVDLFSKAVASFEMAGQEEEVGRTLSSSIQSLVLLGEYDRAMNAACRAREIFVRLNQTQRLARLELNVANIHHRQDRFSEALACYRQAYEQLGAYNDTEGMAAALHNSAVCLIMLNDFQEALQSSLRTREVCSQNGMPLLARQAEYNIAYLFFLRGEYTEALTRLRAIRELCQRDGDSYHEALCNLDESEIYLELNLTIDAAQMADQAMQCFRGLSMPFEQGKSIVNLAIATHKLGDTRKALDLFREAKRILTHEGNKGWQALISLYESVVLHDMGSLVQAKRTCKQALHFFTSAGLERRDILSQLVLVRILIAMDQMPAAEQLCRTALAKLDKTEAAVLRFQAHQLLARLNYAAGSSQAAYELFDKARLELENLRSTIQGDDLKIAFIADKVEVYERLVQLCLKEPARLEQAFEHMEQAKSQALADLVFGKGMPVSVHGSNGVRSRVSLLRRELNWYYHRLDVEQNPKDQISRERIKRLREEVALREDEFVRLVHEMPNQGSDETVLAPAKAIGLEQIRRSLSPATTIVEYYQVDHRFVAVVITADSLNVIPTAGVADVTASIRMLELQMSRFRVPGFCKGQDENQVEQATSGRLRELYEAVFTPIAPFIHTQDVIIVPHGVLHYLPFHALMPGKDHLIDRLTISYAPSATIYAACRSRTVNATGSSLLLGVPDAAAPWIEQEIESVASVVQDPKIFLGAEATERVLREEGRHARLVHVATHGRFRSDSPMFSSVHLADGYMSLYDIYQLKLPVELITLSGCGTGLSEIAAGDELLGLTRGLLAAGAQSLLVTLWDVHDQTTANFMRLFYLHSANTKDKAAALRNSMLELRQQVRHPYYWAPFVLIGNRNNA